jgi:predicted dienelactone hydrolase
MYTIKFFRFIFPVVLLFGQAFADTLVLPEPKGIYGVGTINLELSDPSRTQLPYVANFVKFPDEAKVLTFRDVWKLPRDRGYRYRYDDETIASAIKDIDFLLDNLQVFGNLSSAFDETKIILMGHSIGGNIAHIKGFSDKRIVRLLILIPK